MDRDFRRNTNMIPIFAYIEHQAGVADDTALELASAARAIDSGATPIAVVTGWGKDLEAVCEALRTSYGEVWKIAHPELAYPNAELVRKALLNVLPRGGVVLAPHTHFGTDLGPGLSVKLDSVFVSDVLAIEGAEGASLKISRQEFGGQISAQVRCDISSGAVMNIRPGAFKPLEEVRAVGQVVDKSAEAGELTARRRYLETIVAEAADVDITKHQVLVSIGRGIQAEENIEIAEELAEALGGAVSCSRPVVDAKWLPKSRQVGSSGRTVKPRVYLACGISGSFQHMAGVKGNPMIVAINKNPRAPIFQAAEIGIVDDILEFLPELTERIREPQTEQKTSKHFA
jgi:electron transfer flavoprotein alpha subunit